MQSRSSTPNTQHRWTNPNLNPNPNPTQPQPQPSYPNPNAHPHQVRNELETVERRLAASGQEVDEAQRTGMEKRVQVRTKELHPTP